MTHWEFYQTLPPAGLLIMIQVALRFQYRPFREQVQDHHIVELLLQSRYGERSICLARNLLIQTLIILHLVWCLCGMHVHSILQIVHRALQYPYALQATLFIQIISKIKLYCICMYVWICHRIFLLLRILYKIILLADSWMSDSH